jgi:hypothetical protein
LHFAADLPVPFVYFLSARSVVNIRIFHPPGMFMQRWVRKGKDPVENDLETQSTLEGFREAIDKFFDHENE